MAIQVIRGSAEAKAGLSPFSIHGLNDAYPEAHACRAVFLSGAFYLLKLPFYIGLARNFSGWKRALLIYIGGSKMTCFPV